MPMGPYPDFDACVADQQSKGHDMESSQKICGEIKSRVEGVSRFRFENLSLLNKVGLEREPGWPVGITNFVMENGKRKMTVYVHDHIGPSMAESPITSGDLVPQIENAAHEGVDWLHFNINSPGGSVSHAMAIFNAVQQFPGCKTVEISGSAGSAAGVLAMVGDSISIHENDQFYMHPANVSLAYANAGVLKLGLEMVEKGTEQIIDLFAARSGKPANMVREWIFANDANGTIFTGKESVSLGLCDECIPVRPKYDSMRAQLELIRNQAALRERNVALANMARQSVLTIAEK